MGWDEMWVTVWRDVDDTGEVVVRWQRAADEKRASDSDLWRRRDVTDGCCAYQGTSSWSNCLVTSSVSYQLVEDYIWRLCVYVSRFVERGYHATVDALIGLRVFALRAAGLCHCRRPTVWQWFSFNKTHSTPVLHTLSTTGWELLAVQNVIHLCTFTSAILTCILLGRRPHNISGSQMSVRPSVHKKFHRFQWNLVYS